MIRYDLGDQYTFGNSPLYNYRKLNNQLLFLTRAIDLVF